MRLKRINRNLPEYILPNIVCLLSKELAGARVIKNCDLFVFGPLLAILIIPAPECFNSGVISSSNTPPYILSPPLPVPVGSPPYHHRDA